MLEWLVRSDVEMEGLKRKVKMLTEALDSAETRRPAEVLRRSEFEEAEKELEEARKVALLRSGTRGIKARKEQKLAEIKYSECEKR